LTDPSIYAASFVTSFGGDTAAGAEAALIAGMTNGTAYFNIHTTTYPGGEIRGFLQQVPEPATLALWASAGPVWRFCVETNSRPERALSAL